MKSLKNSLVTTVDHMPYMVSALGADGRANGSVKQGQVSDIIRGVLFSIPRPIWAPNDDIRIAQMVAVLDKSGDTIEMPDALYTWMHGLLKRDVPVAPDAAKAGIKPVSYSKELWDIANAAHIANQLRTDEDKVNFLSMEVQDAS